jgi:membrane protein YdbS with pleckstrin-like domain
VHGAPGDERIRWRTPSPRLWTARWTLLATVSAPVTVALAAAAGTQAGPAAAVATAVAALTAAAFAAALLRARVRSWAYAERAEDLLVRRGVLLRRVTVVPYGRMQFIDVTAGPVDRAFSLATVQLHTAAAATDARIPGLDRMEAARLRDHLAALGEARAAGL